jgi:hypothetical protein
MLSGPFVRRIVAAKHRRWTMLVRQALLLGFMGIAGCTSTPMPHIPNEPPLNNLVLNEPSNVALSPFRIKTSQGARTFVSSYFSQRQPMPGWQAGQDYPIATQTVTHELRSMGINVFESMEGLLAPGIRDKLDFLVSGAIQPIRLDIHDTYSGNYSEGLYRLSLKILDARSGETVWEAESDGQGSLMNDPEVVHDLATGSNIVASLSQNEDRVSRLIITNAFRSMMRGHMDEMMRIFATRTEQR